MKHGLIRFEDWTKPVTPVKRQVISVNGEKSDLPPVLFIGSPAAGGVDGAAGPWLAHIAQRGFAAHELIPRAGGDLRAHVHDVVQTAASLPRQAVLIGHGVGARIVAHALGRYPARAFVLAAPILEGRPILGAALRTNPAGAFPALAGGRLRLNRRQLSGTGAPADDLTPYRIEVFGGGQPPRPVGDPPALVIGSPDDRVVPRAALDRAAARYGGAPLLFPGMGHALTRDAAWSEPIDAILDWLGKELSAG